MATVLRPRPTLHILKDEPDNRILECAIAAQAEYVVSGDRHLLALKHHADITMISLAGFLTKLHKWNLQPRVNLRWRSGSPWPVPATNGDIYPHIRADRTPAAGRFNEAPTHSSFLS